jgi:uncharacterized protein (DUF433 family)
MAVETDRYPNVTHDQSVQGGAAVLRGTRVPVRAIAFYWRAGESEERILRVFPQLTRDTLREAIRYYEAHRAEIDEELRADADA